MDVPLPRRSRAVALAAAVVSGAIGACGDVAAPRAAATADSSSVSVAPTAGDSFVRPLPPSSTDPADGGVAVALVGGIVLAGPGSEARPERIARYCVRLLASVTPSCPSPPYGVELDGFDPSGVPWTGEQGGWRWADDVVVEGQLRDGVLLVSRVGEVTAAAG